MRRPTRRPARVGACGTGLTQGGKTGQGKHLGGLILPGLAMMHRALFEGTSIRFRDLSGPHRHLGRTTAEGIASGGAQAIAALIDRLVLDIALPGQPPPVLVLTGSDAPRIGPLLCQAGRIEPDLVMQGLHAVAKWLERQ